MLHEIRVSGTVLWSPTNTNSPTYTYISKKRVSGNRVSDFRVSGGPPVPGYMKFGFCFTILMCSSGGGGGPVQKIFFFFANFFNKLKFFSIFGIL